MEINSTADIDALIHPTKWLEWFREQHTKLGAARIARITGASLNAIHNWCHGDHLPPRYQRLGVVVGITIDNQER